MEEFLEVEVRDICFFNPFFHPNSILTKLAQRHKLGPNLTPVTPETFAVWKKTRLDKKEAEQEALRKTKEFPEQRWKEQWNEW